MRFSDIYFAVCIIIVNFVSHFQEMFESLKNILYLKFWSGKRKVGPHKKILLSRRYQALGGDLVYDLSWSLRYIYSEHTISHPVVIEQRTDKRRLRKVIRRIERRVIPQEIEKLMSKEST